MCYYFRSEVVLAVLGTFSTFMDVLQLQLLPRKNLFLGSPLLFLVSRRPRNVLFLPKFAQGSTSFWKILVFLDVYIGCLVD